MPRQRTEVIRRLTMGGKAQDVSLREIPSRGFVVYQGERSAFMATLWATTFTMRNDTAGNKRNLTIGFERRYSASLGLLVSAGFLLSSCRTAKGERQR